MKKTLNFIINSSSADQLLSDSKEFEQLKSHCEGMTSNQHLHEFVITDQAGRVVYTSNNAIGSRNLEPADQIHRSGEP